MRRTRLLLMSLLTVTTLSAQTTSLQINTDFRQFQKSYTPRTHTTSHRGTSSPVKTILQNSGINTAVGIVPQGSRRFIRACYLITPEEIAYSQFGSGFVTSVGWTWIALEYQSAMTSGLLKVYLQSTADTTYSKGLSYSAALPGMTKVIDGTIIIPPGEGTYSLDIGVGGTGTSAFSVAAGSGVYVAFEYETTGGLALPFGSPTVSGNDSLVSGIALYNSQVSLSDSLTYFNVRPETRFGDLIPDDVEILSVYTMGEIPTPFGFPDTLGILLETNGIQTLNEIRVTSQNLQNSSYVIDTTFTVSSFTPFISLALPTITFPEQDLVIVKAIPGDVDYQLQYCHYTTPDRYNYADPCAPSDGGLGFSGINGRFVAGFHNYSSQIFPIDAVDHCFINDSLVGNKPYNIVIYQSAPNGMPGALLYSSPLLFSPPGNTYSQSVTHMLTNTVLIPPNSKFFVGYRQAQFQNINSCFEDERPVREDVFYYTLTDTGTVWNDFAIDSSNYRLDIAPRTCKNLKVKLYLEGFFNGAYMIEDKVIVEVRDFAFPYSLAGVDTSHVDSTGTGYFNFPMTNGFSNYYFVVKHRNHLETWSHTIPEKIDTCDDSYNFTDSLSKAYGNNMAYVTLLSRSITGAYAIYAGDVNQDGAVDGTDAGIIDNDAYNFLTGYISSDLNGDNIADATDALLCDNNVYNVVGIMRP